MTALMLACSSGALSACVTLPTPSTGSTLGQPSLFDSRFRTEFSGFNAEVVLRRDFEVFIVKTLLPLFLLVLVVFATLFFPETLFRERINIPVTAILTSA